MQNRKTESRIKGKYIHVQIHMYVHKNTCTGEKKNEEQLFNGCRIYVEIMKI